MAIEKFEDFANCKDDGLIKKTIKLLDPQALAIALKDTDDSIRKVLN